MSVCYDSAPVPVRAKAANRKRVFSELEPDQPEPGSRLEWQAGQDADTALEIVNLSDRKKNYPSQMSGGQQQRVSIARAIMKKPRIILADEPTAALDYTTSIEVLAVMEKIVSEGTTMIMVTHNEEICRMADRVVRMRNGQVAEIAINRRKAHASELVW